MLLRVTLRQLQIFQAVAHARSFVRAGELLHLSQPGVSMQIRQLEEAVGLPLLDRIGRRVVLTEAGQRFLDHAARILGEVQDAAADLDGLKGLQRGRVVIGMVSTAKYFLPRLLARFTAAHPELDLRIYSGNRDELIGTLGRNEIDLAVMGRPPARLELESELFAPHPFVVIAPGGHRLAAAPSLDLFDLRDDTVLLRERGSGTRLLMDDWFRKALFAPRRQIEMGGNETVKQGVLAGLGVSILSRHTLTLELAHGAIAILPVDGTPVMRGWYVAHRAGKRLSPAALALRRFVLEEGGGFLGEAFGAGPADAATARQGARPRRSSVGQSTER
nr:LysR substrate-binding domain-containing protein [Coralloluteibacterium stylophorae]